METIILKDGSTFDIKEGASASEIIATTADFTALGTLADALAVPSNLNTVKFATEGDVTGKYDNMTMDAPLFRAVDIVGGVVQAMFAIRPKTATETRLDALEDTTDLLVMDSLV